MLDCRTCLLRGSTYKAKCQNPSEMLSRTTEIIMMRMTIDSIIADEWQSVP